MLVLKANPKHSSHSFEQAGHGYHFFVDSFE